MAMVNHARSDMIMDVYHLFDLYACAKRGTRNEERGTKMYSWKCVVGYCMRDDGPWCNDTRAGPESAALVISD